MACGRLGKMTYYFVNKRAFCYSVIMYMFFWTHHTERVHIYPDVCLWRSEEILFYSTNAMRHNTNRPDDRHSWLQYSSYSCLMKCAILSIIMYIFWVRPDQAIYLNQNFTKSNKQIIPHIHSWPLATWPSILASHKQKGLRDFFDSEMNSLREFYNVKINEQDSPY